MQLASSHAYSSKTKDTVGKGSKIYPASGLIKDIKLALQDCGRRLSTHIRRRRREADELKKRSYITQYIPIANGPLKISPTSPAAGANETFPSPPDHAKPATTITTMSTALPIVNRL